MKLSIINSGIVGTNTYMIFNHGQAVIIDPEGSGENILRQIKKNDSKPVAALLTHGHFDHVGAAAFLRAQGIKLYGHPADKNLHVFRKMNVPEYELDFELSDNTILDISGLKINVIFTPGHSTGSVCFIVEDNIFTGDTLFYHDHGRTDLPGGSQEDMNRSLIRLFKLSGDYTIYPGHGEKSRLSEERRFFGYV